MCTHPPWPEQSDCPPEGEASLFHRQLKPALDGDAKKILCDAAFLIGLESVGIPNRWLGNQSGSSKEGVRTPWSLCEHRGRQAPPPRGHRSSLLVGADANMVLRDKWGIPLASRMPE